MEAYSLAVNFERVAVDHRGNAGHVGQGRGGEQAQGDGEGALQIHGGNGYALEYKISRVLCDARILNIFEGAAEIQANIIARGLLSGRN